MAPGVYKQQSLLITLLLILFFQGVVLHRLNLTLGFTSLPPYEVVAYRNKPLILNCSGYTDPEYGPLEISWKHDGQDIKVNKQQQQLQQQQVLANGSLYIEKFQSVKKSNSRQDDGSYTCVLKNKLGALLSRPTQVTVSYMAKQFSQQPMDTMAEAGSTARFQCQIPSMPSANFTWFLNDHVLPHAINRFILQSSGSLSIVNVSHADAGSYYCIATSGTRRRESQKAVLTILEVPRVHQPPQFLSSSLQHIAVVNHTVVLECLAKGWPSVNVQWRKLGGNLPSDRAHIKDPGHLEIRSVRLGDEGTYVCEASNVDPATGETYKASQQSILVVHSPPEFVTEPKSQVKPTAQTTRFECLAQGVPTPSLHWFKDGQPLYINGRIKQLTGNVLVISQTILSDSGLYQCMAFNEAGAVMTSARLRVNVSSNQPSPPYGLKGKTLSSRAIQLTWLPGYSPKSLKIQAYTVHYLPTSGGSELQKVAVNTSQIIDKLQPYTNYSFYVRAYNGRSASELSETITQMTGEDVPVDVPSVTTKSLSPSTLLVSWDKLPIEKTRGIVTKYMIHHRKHNQASYSVIEVPGNVQEYTLTGLLHKKKYDVRVMAGTSAGYPSFNDNQWQWITHEMPDVATSKVPSSPILHLTVVNSTTLEVKWSTPEDIPGVRLQGFRLSYRQKGLPLQGPFEVPANVTSFILTDLAPQAWYEVHVYGFNEEGEGQESLRNILTLSEDHPDSETVEVVEPPHQLEVDPVKSSKVKVVWKAPINSRNISYYTIRYGVVTTNGVNVSTPNYIRSTNSEVTIENLTPYTLYAFAVRSHDTNNHQGPFSEQMECRTLEDVPSAPLDFKWSFLNSTSIRLNWAPPVSPNGIISAYQILFSLQPEASLGLLELTLDKWQTQKESGTRVNTVVSGLVSNTLYYFCVRAETGAGFGASSPLIAVNIRVQQNATKVIQEASSAADLQDPFLGVVLGISIGFCCIIICVIIIIYRNRCYPHPHEQQQPHVGPDLPHCLWCYCRCLGRRPGHLPNGRSSHPTGNGQNRASSSDCQELDCFTPMLTHFPGSFGNHTESKSSYSMTNGHANGFAHHIKDRPYANGIRHKGNSLAAEEARLESSPCRSALLSDSGWEEEESSLAVSPTTLVTQDYPIHSCNGALQPPELPEKAEEEEEEEDSNLRVSKNSLATNKVPPSSENEEKELVGASLSPCLCPDLPEDIQGTDSMPSVSSHKQLPLLQYFDTAAHMYITDDKPFEASPHRVQGSMDNGAVVAMRLQTVN